MTGPSEAHVARRTPPGKPARAPARRSWSGARWLGGVIWPQRSLVTGREVPGPGVLEPDKWSAIRFITGALCNRCGVPFEIEVDPDQVCGACLASPPAYGRARAAVEYGDATRDIVLAFKHQGRRDGLATFGRWMASAGQDLLAGADLIVPVPLHYVRLVRRGFNQSVWLAAAVSRSSGVPLSPDLLARTRATPTQAGLSGDGRRRNVQGAFNVRPSRARRLAGRRVILVDDVLTTGATVEACARALKRSGAAEVDVLTLARVAAPRRAPI